MGSCNAPAPVTIIHNETSALAAVGMGMIGINQPGQQVSTHTADEGGGSLPVFFFVLLSSGRTKRGIDRILPWVHDKRLVKPPSAIGHGRARRLLSSLCPPLPYDSNDETQQNTNEGAFRNKNRRLRGLASSIATA